MSVLAGLFQKEWLRQLLDLGDVLVTGLVFFVTFIPATIVAAASLRDKPIYWQWVIFISQFVGVSGCIALIYIHGDVLFPSIAAQGGASKDIYLVRLYLAPIILLTFLAFGISAKTRKERLLFAALTAIEIAAILVVTATHVSEFE